MFISGREKYIVGSIINISFIWGLGVCIDEWILEQRVVYVDLSLCDVYGTYKRIGRIFP